MPTRAHLLRSIRLWLSLFMLGLILSGLTAFPLQHELDCLVRLFAPVRLPALNAWLLRVDLALHDAGARYPFLAYGTDWLGFAHLVIAIAFLGPWRDPVRNQWVVTFGLLACAAVVPFALIAGPLRGIPVFWSFIDCTFGLLGGIPLLIVRYQTGQLEQIA